MAKDFTNRQGGGQKLNKLRRKIGAILIEFAFAIPVFLVLIYYIHDLPKQKLIQRKMQFVANEIAAVLQNISSQRVVNMNDIQYAIRLAMLSYFPGMTQYSTEAGYSKVPLGYMAMVHVIYVVGTDGGKAMIKWRKRLFVNGNWYHSNTNSSLDSIITKSDGAPSDIHPNLRISREGEAKVIVECSFYKDSTIKASVGVPNHKVFGFLIHSPKATSRGLTFFTTVSIFTPVGTGFSEKAPQ